jgi:hypothetical protein
MPRGAHSGQIAVITGLAIGVARRQLSSAVTSADPRGLQALAQVVSLFPSALIEANPRLRELVELVDDIARTRAAADDRARMREQQARVRAT